jgi:hypothetical protein
LGYEFLDWPEDLGTGRLSARAMQATLGDARFDAIIVRETPTIGEIAAIWKHKSLHVLPVIDLTGTLGVAADLDASRLKARETDEVRHVVRRFQDRRALLHRDLLFSDNPGEQLVGRVFVSGRSLIPAFDPTSRDLVAYNTLPGAGLVGREAEALCGEGLFKRTFFERLHACARCHSRRLIVREECARCRSSQLGEEQYVHHFRCAFQGPEADFRLGDDLVCPKCRRELSHFGYDYDRPGTMVACSACGHATSECAIGFVCLDCGAHADGESCPTIDVFSYELTEHGKAFAEHGRSMLGQARRTLWFADLPIELVIALNAAGKQFNEDATPFALVSIFYEREREIAADHGAREFAKVRDLFIENMRAGLGEFGIVVKGRSHDFALLNDIGPHQAQGGLERLRLHASSTLRLDLGARFQAFGPEDFS